MKTLWTFGDSFTAFYDPRVPWSGEYIKWKGYIPKVYGEIIAEELGYRLINRGAGGVSNQTILELICNNIDDIKPGDLVIIGWSSQIRFRLVDEYDEWQDLIPHSLLKNKKTGGVNVESILEILENRYHIKYCSEIESWIKLVNKSLIDCDVIHWKYHIEKLNVPMITNKESISQETNGLIDDGHYSENGQKEVAKILMEILKSGNKKKLI